jgi:endoglycosylceramidase
MTLVAHRASLPSKMIGLMLRRCLLLLLAAGLCAPSAAGAARAGLPWVHAIRGPHARIADEHGRQVILHGVNVNQLGDYFKKNSHPASAPLTRADFTAMRRLGFDHVRLLMHWSLLEPTPGTLSAAYVARIRQAVAWARENDIYVLLDMHQDAYGKYTAARPGELCPPGFDPALGWDGAPAWATLTGGMPRCAPGETRELSPAVATAFQNLWADAAGPGGVGIQTRLVATWRRVAAAFAGDSTVMGYDLFNEPSPGLIATGGEGSTIVPYYRRAIAAIRAVDKRHAIVVEPQVLRSAISDPIQMPFVSADPNLIYAPHIYADRNGLSPRGTGTAQAEEWTHALREASEAGGGDADALPLFLGEFGAVDPPGRVAYDAEFAALADRFASGWSHWVWKETCGDPHTDYGTFPDESMNTYDCARDRFTGVKPARANAYSRTYPTHAPGRIAAMSFDPATGRFALSAVEAPRAGAPLRVSIPLALHYGGSLGRVSVATRGLARIRLRRCTAGLALLTARAAGGDYALTLLRRARARTPVPAAYRREHRCALAGG